MRHLIWRTFQYRREQHCSSCRDKTQHIDVYILYNSPTCNRCAVFEEDEEVNGWRAGISVGYCNGCDLNLGEMASSEKLYGTEASTMNSLNETRKSLTPSPSSESVAIKFDSLSSTFETNVELCRI